jgi:tetratricopeptide (TPR) repeat protein
MMKLHLLMVLSFISTVGLAAPASAEMNINNFLKTHCDENVSCALRPLPRTPIQNNRKSLITDILNIDTTLCTDDNFAKVNPDTVAKVCSELRRKTNLTDKQRATIISRQAYATMQLELNSKSEFEDRESVKLYNKALLFNPADLTPLYGLAEVHLIMGDEDGALDVYRKAIAKEPLSSDILAHYARLNSTLGRYSKALEIVNQTLKVDANDPLARYVLGVVNFRNGNMTAAEQAFIDVKQDFHKIHQPKFSFYRLGDPLSWLSQVYDKVNDPVKGLAATTENLKSEMDPWERSTIFAARGKFYEALGKFKEASADYDAASKTAFPDMVKQYETRRDLVLIRTASNTDEGRRLRTELELGKLQTVLKIQVFLRNQGYTTVEVNGIYDGATKLALDTCLAERLCEQGAGFR